MKNIKIKKSQNQSKLDSKDLMTKQFQEKVKEYGQIILKNLNSQK